jgi:hypothetical protein
MVIIVEAVKAIINDPKLIRIKRDSIWVKFDLTRE